MRNIYLGSEVNKGRGSHLLAIIVSQGIGQQGLAKDSSPKISQRVRWTGYFGKEGLPNSTGGQLNIEARIGQDCNYLKSYFIPKGVVWPRLG